MARVCLEGSSGEIRREEHLPLGATAPSWVVANREIYFVGTNRNQIEPSDVRVGVYQLTGVPPCNSIRLFRKIDMRPYSVSLYSYERGFANEWPVRLRQMWPPKQARRGELPVRLFPLRPVTKLHSLKRSNREDGVMLQ